MHVYSLFGHWYCVWEVGVQKLPLIEIGNCPTHLLLPHVETTLWIPPPSWSKSHSHFDAFFLKAKLLTEAIAAKGTSRSQNNVKKSKIPKNKPEKPELSNPSATATYTVAISSIHSSLVSENKQEESTQPILTNRSTAAAPTISTPESSIDFDVEKMSLVIKRKAENSERDKPKSKQTKLSSYFAKNWILFFLHFVV